jgi:hypothetical protein
MFGGTPAAMASGEAGPNMLLKLTVAAPAETAARPAKKLAKPANFLVMMHLAPVVSKFIRQDPKK